MKIELDHELIAKCKVVGSSFAEWVCMNEYISQTTMENWHAVQEVMWLRKGDSTLISTSQLWALFMEQFEREVEDNNL